MDPTESAELIDKAGGDTKFGRLLGIDRTDGFQQRIHNWRSRGIPAAVVLEHLNVIEELKAAPAPEPAEALN